MLPTSPRFLSLVGALALGFVSTFLPAHGAVVINEIMYRPGTGFPEIPALEYIELHNTDTAAAVSLAGWALTSGVSFVFPPNASIPAGGYVVVAANPAALGVAGAFGPWTGTL